MSPPPATAVTVWFDAVEPVAAPACEPPSAQAARLAAGHADALAALYRQHHETVRAFARRLLGDAHHAEDLVHEVFLAVPAAFRVYRAEAAIPTLLLSIAVNKAKHHVRGAIRARRAFARLGEQPRSATASAPDAESERRELCDELQRALDRLPIDQRVVVVLCAVEERTAREVAGIVGAPENTVRTRLFHAMRKLREMMAPAGREAFGVERRAP
jgi:RNA polymerase sigma-70 factor (ECF subfamily)